MMSDTDYVSFMVDNMPYVTGKVKSLYRWQIIHVNILISQEQWNDGHVRQMSFPKKQQKYASLRIDKEHDDNSEYEKILGTKLES